MRQNTKIYFLITIFGAVLSLLIIFVIPYFLIQIKENFKILNSEKQKIKILQFKLENFRNLQEKHQDLINVSEKINKLFINPDTPVEFIKFLEQTSRVCGVSIKISFLPSLKQKSDPWKSISFQINTSGSFSNFFRFFEKLENAPYLIEISNLNIKKTEQKTLDENTSTRNIDANFTIKTFSN